MYPLFKSLWKAYWFLFCGGSLIAFLLLSNLIRQSNDGFLLIWLIWTICYFGYIYIVSTALNIIAVKKIGLTVDTLNNCKAKDFTDIYESFQKQIVKNPKRFNRLGKVLVLVNLSTGYLTQGDYQSAKVILEKIPRPKDKENSVKAVYANNWCDYYLGVNDLEQAQKCFENFHQLLENKAILKSEFIDAYEIIKVEISIARGDYEDVEATLKMLLKNAKNLLREVSCHFKLSQVYIYENRFDEARDMLEFVIKNGGDTRYVNQAQVLLKQINGVNID